LASLPLQGLHDIAQMMSLSEICESAAQIQHEMACRRSQRRCCLGKLAPAVIHCIAYSELSEICESAQMQHGQRRCYLQCSHNIAQIMSLSEICESAQAQHERRHTATVAFMETWPPRPQQSQNSDENKVKTKRNGVTWLPLHYVREVARHRRLQGSRQHGVGGTNCSDAVAAPLKHTRRRGCTQRTNSSTATAVVKSNIYGAMLVNETY
jgi:hypothetical protein